MLKTFYKLKIKLVTKFTIVFNNQILNTNLDINMLTKLNINFQIKIFLQINKFDIQIHA